MAATPIFARFVTEAEAWRAATMLRAAGIADASIEIGDEGPDELGRDDAGVPDASAGMSGMRTDEPAPAARITLRVSGLDEARVDASELRRIVEAAGGRPHDG